MLSSEKLRIKQKITYNGKYLSMYTKYILNKNWDAITFMAPMTRRQKHYSSPGGATAHTCIYCLATRHNLTALIQHLKRSTGAEGVFDQVFCTYPTLSATGRMDSWDTNT